MAKKDKNKRHAAKQRKWEEENKQILHFRSRAPAAKAAARAGGFALPFYEFLDSYEEEFHAIVREAPKRFPSLIGAFELDDEDYAREDHAAYGVGADWRRVVFTTQSELASTYNDPDPAANINGKTQAFIAPGGELRTLVFIPRQIKCDFEHREHKYHFKLIALCHELGHVVDLEKRVNLDAEARTADVIEAEVYAHLFALKEANRRGLYCVADTLEKTLGNYSAGTDYRGEVARRLQSRYQRPERKRWQDYIGEK